MVNKKFCIECGFELSTIAKFCEECGAKLIESKTSKLDIESETNAEIEIEHPPQKIKSPNLTTEKNSQKTQTKDLLELILEQDLEFYSCLYI